MAFAFRNIIYVSKRLPFLGKGRRSCSRTAGIRSARMMNSTALDQEALQPHPLCNGTPDGPVARPLRLSHSAGTSSSRCKPLYRLQIKTSELLGLAVWLASVGVTLLLTVLSGRLQQLLPLWLAMLSWLYFGWALVRFGGRISRDEVCSEVQLCSRREETDEGTNNQE